MKKTKIVSTLSSIVLFVGIFGTIITIGACFN